MLNKEKSSAHLVAWLTCDSVYVDPATGKHTLLGVFSNLKANVFPIVHPRMIWFVSISDVSKGTHNLKISISPSDYPENNSSSKRIIIDRDFESDGKWKKINLINDIKRLKLDKPDDYSIEIEIDDEILYVDTLTLEESKNPKNI